MFAFVLVSWSLSHFLFFRMLNDYYSTWSEMHPLGSIRSLTSDGLKAAGRFLELGSACDICRLEHLLRLREWRLCGGGWELDFGALEVEWVLEGHWGAEAEWALMKVNWGAKADWTLMEVVWGAEADWTLMEVDWGAEADWTLMEFVWGAEADWALMEFDWGMEIDWVLGVDWGVAVDWGLDVGGRSLVGRGLETGQGFKDVTSRT